MWGHANMEGREVWYDVQPRSVAQICFIGWRTCCVHRASHRSGWRLPQMACSLSTLHCPVRASAPCCHARLLRQRSVGFAWVAPAHVQAPRLIAWLCHGTGERIAIEVDGAHKFSSNTHAPGGSIIAHHRLLVARGWAVIHVPSYVWGALDSSGRRAWLLRARSCFGAPLKAAQQVPARCILRVSHEVFACCACLVGGVCCAAAQNCSGPADTRVRGHRRYSARASGRRRPRRCRPGLHRVLGLCQGLLMWPPSSRRSGSWTAWPVRRAPRRSPIPMPVLLGFKLQGFQGFFAYPILDSVSSAARAAGFPMPQRLFG